MHRFLLLAASLLFSTALFATDIVVLGAWVREAPPMAKALGGFMVLKNQGKSERHLVAAAAPDFAEVMLHRTVVDGEVARMVHQPEVTVPPGGRIEFRPGDYHLMLMHPGRRYVAGDQIDITLTFKDGEAVEVPFHVLKGMSMGSAMNHDAH
jgi:copper(I)-binding protein